MDHKQKSEKWNKSTAVLSLAYGNFALVHSKNLAALALSRRICAHAHAQFFRDLALALKKFWAPLNFALILKFQRVFNLFKYDYISPEDKL